MFFIKFLASFASVLIRTNSKYFYAIMLQDAKATGSLMISVSLSIF